MSIWQLIVLAIIQGLTEFLPISSSAHLILPAKIFGWPDQGPMIDVMAHFGTLFAVMIYFRKDVASILSGLIDLPKRRLNPQSLLALNLILATPPAILLAAILHFSGWDVLIRSTWVIAATTIIFGVVLWVSDIVGAREKTTEDLSWKGAIWLGLMQSLALIPGTSRSGITMTAARFMGYTRVEAARFSMLMSLPIIGVGGVFSLYELSGSTTPGVGLTEGIIVGVLSFMVAYISIAFFMRWISRIGMFPFMVYRLVLGTALLIWLFTGNA